MDFVILLFLTVFYMIKWMRVVLNVIRLVILIMEVVFLFKIASNMIQIYFNVMSVKLGMN